MVQLWEQFPYTQRNGTHMHTPTPGIQAFAFDFGGVLADFIDPSGMLRLAEVAHVPPEAFKAAWSRYRNQLDSDEIAVAEYWSLVLDSCGSSVPSTSAIPLLQQIDTEGFSHMRTFHAAVGGGIARIGYGDDDGFQHVDGNVQNDRRGSGLDSPLRPHGHFRTIGNQQTRSEDIRACGFGIGSERRQYLVLRRYGSQRGWGESGGDESVAGTRYEL